MNHFYDEQTQLMTTFNENLSKSFSIDKMNMKINQRSGSTSVICCAIFSSLFILLVSIIVIRCKMYFLVLIFKPTLSKNRNLSKMKLTFVNVMALVDWLTFLFFYNIFCEFQ